MTLIGTTCRFLRGEMGKNTAWMTMSGFVRLLIQGAYFVILTRSLGLNALGAWAGASAFVSIAIAFAGWGSGNIMIMNVARNPRSFPTYFGNAIWMSVCFGVACSLILLIVRPLVIPNISWELVAAVAITQLLAAQLIDVFGQAFQAFNRLWITGSLSILLGLCQLIAVGLFAWLPQTHDAKSWAVWNLSATVVVMAAGLTISVSRLGRPIIAMRPLPGSLSVGWHFSISLASRSIYNDMDKTLLARLSTLEATGIYATAYRAIFMGFTPMRSLLAAAYPKFFREGASGLRGSLRLNHRLLPLAIGYGALASIGLFVLAPVIPYVLGAEYAPAVAALRWLSPLLLLQCIHTLAADTLTGAGYQPQRSNIQICAAFLNVVLCLILIPPFSWRGAAWASIATDGALAVAMWLMIWSLLRRETTARQQGEGKLRHGVL